MRFWYYASHCHTFIKYPFQRFLGKLNLHQKTEEPITRWGNLALSTNDNERGHSTCLGIGLICIWITKGKTFKASSSVTKPGRSEAPDSMDFFVEGNKILEEI